MRLVERMMTIKLLPAQVLILGVITAWVFLQACHSGKTSALTEHFSPMISPADTIYVSSEVEKDEQDPAIPFAKFSAALDTTLSGQMIYPPDSMDTQIYGHWGIPISGDYDAYLVEVRQFWFIFKYLLLYSKKEQRFTALLPLAQFYGGDGGQVRTESRLFDLNEKNGPKILTRISEHSLVLSGDEMTDTYDEAVELRQWEEDVFKEIPVPDSSRWIRAYPIGW